LVGTNTSNLNSFFCERSKIVDCNIDNTSINRFFLTKLSCDNLRFDSSHIEEVYASSAVNQNIALNNCTVKVFNAHEAKFDTIDFGNSHIDRVLMRAASVKLINAKNLVARLFLIGYYDNDIQELQVSEATTGTKEGIETLVFKKIVPNELDREKVESARQQQIPKVFTMN
jgi:hypothetical protein